MLIALGQGWWEEHYLHKGFKRYPIAGGQFFQHVRVSRIKSTKSGWTTNSLIVNFYRTGQGDAFMCWTQHLFSLLLKSLLREFTASRKPDFGWILKIQTELNNNFVLEASLLQVNLYFKKWSLTQSTWISIIITILL